MRIGIDFDNTIACYDGVFHKAAVERGLVPADVSTDKTSVRDYLRSAGRNDDWTELQGYIYGARMDLVACYPGVSEFLARASAAGHLLCIISHKTRHPYVGERHDLHEAARTFLRKEGIVGSAPAAVPADQLFFELTLQDKLARIAVERCDVFIDDLPEFLAEPSFPAATRPILFDPENHSSGGRWRDRTFEAYSSWASLADALLERVS